MLRGRCAKLAVLHSAILHALGHCFVKIVARLRALGHTRVSEALRAPQPPSDRTYYTQHKGDTRL